MSTKVEQNSELDDKNQGTCTDLIISSQITTVTRSASLQTASKSEVANSQNRCPTLGDRTDLQRLPEQTKQAYSMNLFVLGVRVAVLSRN